MGFIRFILSRFWKLCLIALIAYLGYTFGVSVVIDWYKSLFYPIEDVWFRDILTYGIAVLFAISLGYDIGKQD